MYLFWIPLWFTWRIEPPKIDSLLSCFVTVLNLGLGSGLCLRLGSAMGLGLGSGLGLE